MTKKRFTYCPFDGFEDNGKQMSSQKVEETLNKFQELSIGDLKKIEQLEKENEQLKECLNEVKNDEKQLSIDFMGFKMKLIEQLQIHYDYASEQRQKNLDNLLIAKAYDIIRYDVKKLAEEMRVDLDD